MQFNAMIRAMNDQLPIVITAEDSALVEGLRSEGFKASLIQIPGCICISSIDNMPLFGNILITGVMKRGEELGRWVLACASYTAVTRSWRQVCDEIRSTSEFPNGLWIQNTEPDQLSSGLGFGLFVSADVDAAALRAVILAVDAEARRALELLFARISHTEIFEAGIEAGRAAA